MQPKRSVGDYVNVDLMWTDTYEASAAAKLNMGSANTAAQYVEQAKAGTHEQEEANSLVHQMSNDQS